MEPLTHPEADATPQPQLSVPDPLAGHGVLLFDGVCNFCNGSVNFIIDHDPKGYFKFAALQSEAGQKLLERFNLPRSDFDTMIVIEQDKVYTKSTAGMRIARHLGFPWSLGSLGLILPRFIRDAGYSLVARNRYKWFGKQDQCRIPTPEIRARFLG
ncbi:MAG: thiol-disulfide oxidoreductase DCC family protein [Candidatus Sericytochromatia bacterium]